MLLSKSVALSILVTLGVKGLVIPSVGDIIDVFALDKTEEKKSEDSQMNTFSGESNGVHSLKEKFKGKGSKKGCDKGAEVEGRRHKKAKGKHGEGKYKEAGEYRGKKSKHHSGKHDIESKEHHLKKMKSKDGFAPVMNVERSRDIIPHKYIVVMNDEVTLEELLYHQELISLEHVNSLEGLEETHSFFASTKDFKAEGGIVDSFDIDALKGYSGFFLDSTVEVIRKNPLVKFVEKDSIVYANEFETQKGAPWGLARVSHRQPLSLNSFNQYLYDTEGGAGVTSYIIDTGINIDHVEFGGRAKWGSTIPYGDIDVDGNGHGTHCAGTIASSAYGIAKNADVVAVKVLGTNGSGTMSDVVKGVEFAAKAHQEAVKQNKKGFKGSTANMSLGGGKSPALDLAVNAAVKAGIHFAVAAGNENQDACNTSPASSELAITVGASTISDARAYFSNYGPCVDIFAPGLNILSTYIGSESATATLSGTSMASPHIAGLLSYFVSLQPGAESEFFVSTKGVSTTQLKKNLIHYGSKNLLTDIPDDGTPNILAFNGAGHNLTEFWDESAESKFESDVESGIESVMHKLEIDPESFLQDVKGLLDDTLDRLTENLI